MSRRRADADQEFGSDSFLDIIANIVGILIILIVVAGIKVARQPVATSEVVTDAPADQTLADESAVVFAANDSNADVDQPQRDDAAGDPGGELPAEVAVAIDTLSEPAVPKVQVDQSAEELDAEIGRLTLYLRDLESDAETAEVQMAALSNQLKSTADEQNASDQLRDHLQQKSDQLLDIEDQIADARTQLASYRGSIRATTERQEYVAEALRGIGLETRKLKEVIQQAEEDDGKADRILHRLAPVGRAVTDDELHFRLSGGRVAHIPLDGLLQRMKEQVADRRHIVMRYQRYEGVAGPVGGFSMRYTVRREMMAPLQALQYGQNAFRLSVARWSIHPAETLQAETVAAAVQLGSRFRQIVEAAEQDTTVTIWVYGADFEHFAALRQLIHRLNLRVAARPLPDGTPIAGSPSGSRSASQ